MKWLILIFILSWLFCTACENIGNKTIERVNNKIDNKLFGDKEKEKKRIREAKGFLNFLYNITSIGHRFK